MIVREEKDWSVVGAASQAGFDWLWGDWCSFGRDVIGRVGSDWLNIGDWSGCS